jgi:hypothetical protein
VRQPFRIEGFTGNHSAFFGSTRVARMPRLAGGRCHQQEHGRRNEGRSALRAFRAHPAWDPLTPAPIRKSAGSPACSGLRSMSSKVSTAMHEAPPFEAGSPQTKRDCSLRALGRRLERR